jgi:hypothetical protein
MKTSDERATQAQPTPKASDAAKEAPRHVLLAHGETVKESNTQHKKYATASTTIAMAKLMQENYVETDKFVHRGSASVTPTTATFHRAMAVSQMAIAARPTWPSGPIVQHRLTGSFAIPLEK